MQAAYLDKIKPIYSKLITNIKLNGEQLKANPLKLRMIQGCPLSPYLFNTMFAVLAKAIKQLKEIKGIQIEKEDV